MRMSEGGLIALGGVLVVVGILIATLIQTGCG